MEKRTDYQISTSIDDEIVEITIKGIVTEDFFKKVQGEVNNAL
jgi:hypothetical protein